MQQPLDESPATTDEQRKARRARLREAERLILVEREQAIREKAAADRGRKR